MEKDLAAAPKQHGGEELPEPVAKIHSDGYWTVGKSFKEPLNFASMELYTADQLRTAIAAERERVRLEHARELVEAHREAFVGNIEALSKLDLDAMNAQPLLMAVQNWDISTGRARELLRCWVLGTFKPDMLPECGDELFAEADEPRDAWAKLQAELSTLRQHLAEAVRERDALRAQVDAAVPAMRDYARRNPRWESWDNGEVEGKMQDPNGVNAWLEQIDAAIAARGEAN